jgi:RNA-directed DNA polymerase
MRKQMTVLKVDTGALKGRTKRWRAIDWRKAHREVKRLQMRIAKATKEGRHGIVRSLQWLLTHSFYAKALAVKRVTSNKGKNTPGVDGTLWKGAKVKMQSICSLRQHGYKAKPLRRMYLRKKSGKLRPLSIPTMYDRAMQALYKLALTPIAETGADRNSYGFREGRCCADAVAASFNALSKPNSATWVLEADISGCFDNISKTWLEDNIPMEKRILKQWLNCGYVEKGITYPSRKGTPQGGIISPTLSNMTLDGLEQVIYKAAPWRSRVNFIRYADDFVVTAKSKQVLEQHITPAINTFLDKRGLKLSTDKTRITFIRNGFDFLGQTFRKYGNTLRITPSAEGIRSLKIKVGKIIRKYVSAPMKILIKKLNQTLQGWANYHRHVVASEAFKSVDNFVYEHLWKMLKKRHPKKSKGWLINKYWWTSGKKWVFSVKRTCKGKSKIYQVIRASSIGIKRHIKIKADANPYFPEHVIYFIRRKKKESCFMSKLSAREIRKANKEVISPGCFTKTALMNA